MNKFFNLMSEIEALGTARGYNTLDAVMFIREYQDQYPSEIRRELKDFMHECEDSGTPFSAYPGRAARE
jgi:hypothetical protein